MDNGGCVSKVVAAAAAAACISAMLVEDSD